MLKIAICDDEQPIRDYLKKLTEKCTDAQVHVFAHGEELLSDPTAYDIILLDISLNQKPDSGKQNGMEVMDKAISQIRKEKNAQPLIIRMDGNYIKISVNNIIYAENEVRKIVLHTKNMKEETYRFYEKMEVLEQKLGDDFFRSHRGFLVNLQEVVRYDNANVELKNGDKVFLAKQKYNDFVTAYMNYLRKA